MTDMQKEISKIIAENIGRDDFDENTKLISSGYIDSYGVMMAITDMEEKFGVEFDLEELEFEQFNTVVLIENCIKKLKGEQ